MADASAGFVEAYAGQSCLQTFQGQRPEGLLFLHRGLGFVKYGGACGPCKRSGQVPHQARSRQRNLPGKSKLQPPETVQLPTVSDVCSAFQPTEPHSMWIGASLDFKAANKQVNVAKQFADKLYGYMVCVSGNGDLRLALLVVLLVYLRSPISWKKAFFGDVQPEVQLPLRDGKPGAAEAGQASRHDTELPQQDES